MIYSLAAFVMFMVGMVIVAVRTAVHRHTRSLLREESYDKYVANHHDKRLLERASSPLWCLFIGYEAIEAAKRGLLVEEQCTEQLTTIARLEQELANAKGIVLQQIGQVAQLGREVAGLEASLAEKEANYVALEKRLSQVSSASSSYHEQMTMLSQAVDTKNEEIASLKTAIEERDARITVDQAQLARYSRCITELNHDIESQHTLIGQLDTNYRDLHTKLVERERQLTEARGTIASWLNRHGNLRTREDRVRELHDTLQFLLQNGLSRIDQFREGCSPDGDVAKCCSSLPCSDTTTTGCETPPSTFCVESTVRSTCEGVSTVTFVTAATPRSVCAFGA